MAQFKTTNAITHRLAQMRAKWIDIVQPETKAVIWQVELDEVRMVEAFTQLEASEHGEIPTYFLDFTVPFQSYEQYGLDLIADWLERWENAEARQPLIDAGLLPDWDGQIFKKIAPAESLYAFVASMASFAKQIDGIRGRLVLNVMPAHSQDKVGFQKWIKDATEHLPDELCLMLYDVLANECFLEFAQTDDVVSLPANLNMQGAMREIVSSGDPSESGVKFNLCILNIGDALNQGDHDEVHHWGETAVKVGQELKVKNLEATGLVVYATALFQLQEYDQALDLYHKSEEVANIGNAAGDVASGAILLQVYSMKAAVFVLQKKFPEAIEYYRMMAKEAEKQGNHMLETEAYRLLAELPSKSLSKQDRYEYLKEGYTAGKRLQPETQKYSSQLLICYQLCEYAELFKDAVRLSEVDRHANSIWGEKWRKLAQDGGASPMIIETSNPISHVTRS